jgi:hypothetical protein
MRELGGICAGIAGVVLLFGYLAWSHLEFYKRGYAKGREDAEKWWIGLEEEVDQERVKIWRDEQ